MVLVSEEFGFDLEAACLVCQCQWVVAFDGYVIDKPAVACVVCAWAIGDWSGLEADCVAAGEVECG